MHAMWLEVFLEAALSVGLIVTATLVGRRQQARAANNVAARRPATLQEQFRTLLRSSRLAEQRLYSLEEAPQDELGREYDEISKLSKVLDVEVSGTSLVVTTDVLYCVNPATRLRHEIGAFKIYIPMNRYGEVEWHNETRRRGGTHHPHIYNSGRACYGNASTVFHNAIYEQEILLAVQLAIQFVESVKPGDQNGSAIFFSWPLSGPFSKRRRAAKAVRDEETYKKSRAAYIRACSERTRELQSEARQTARDRQWELARMEESYFQSKREDWLKERGLSCEPTEDDLQPELERLRQVAQVRKVSVSNRKVLVYTDKLCATTASGECYELGEFLIEIPLGEFGGGIRWTNQTRRVNTPIADGMYAPYVFAAGNACTDDIKETFIDLLAQFELSMLGELAIQFVTTINDDQLGKFIDRWPKRPRSS